MKNLHGRCEVCDTPMGTDCNCFCECGLPHNQCVCEMRPEDYDTRKIRYFTHGASECAFYIYEGDKEPRNDGEVQECEREDYLLFISQGYEDTGYFYP